MNRPYPRPRRSRFSGGTNDIYKQYPKGTVIDILPEFHYTVQLDDGRVLYTCYFSRSAVGCTINPMFPQLGQRVTAEESPFSPGEG